MSVAVLFFYLNCFYIFHNTVILIWFTSRVSHFLNLLEYELKQQLDFKPKWDLTTRCCWQHLRTRACPQWSASASHPSLLCLPCAWWCPPSDWFALRVKNTQLICSLRSGRRVFGFACWLTFCVEQFSVFVQIGEEKAVYQRGFTQTRFSWNTKAAQISSLMFV